MRILSIVFSVLAIFLFAIEPLFFNSVKDIVELIVNKKLFITISLFIFFLSYLFFFFQIRKTRDFIFIFLVFICLLSLLLLTIFSINQPLLNIKVDKNIIKFIMIIFCIFSLINLFQSSITYKTNNIILLYVYRFLFFIATLFSILIFLGNLHYKIIYQYITLFSILTWKLMINFTFTVNKRL
ncbi:MAG: hypothetical protein ACK4YF_08930 [Exilispira sp.]